MKNLRRLYSPQEDAAIRANYPRGGVAACREFCQSRTDNSIRGRTRVLGLYRPEKFYTADEEMVLRKFYRQIGPRECTKMLVRHTYDAVVAKANRMGLQYSARRWPTHAV